MEHTCIPRPTESVGPLPWVCNVLLLQLDEFATSREYAALSIHECRKPERIFLAMGRFLSRYQRAELQGRLSEGQVHTLRALYQVLELLARTDDPCVRELLQELFTGLARDKALAGAIEGRLGPSSKALFKR